MKEVKNEKGFLVLEVTRSELVGALAEYGCIGICDSCCCSPEVGYYVAVLNKWLCKECFDSWYKNAVRYQEDMPIEKRHYELYIDILNQ